MDRWTREDEGNSVLWDAEKYWSKDTASPTGGPETSAAPRCLYIRHITSDVEIVTEKL